MTAHPAWMFRFLPLVCVCVYVFPCPLCVCIPSAPWQTAWQHCLHYGTKVQYGEIQVWNQLMKQWSQHSKEKEKQRQSPKFKAICYMVLTLCAHPSVLYRLSAKDINYPPSLLPHVCLSWSTVSSALSWQNALSTLGLMSYRHTLMGLANLQIIILVNH